MRERERYKEVRESLLSERKAESGCVLCELVKGGGGDGYTCNVCAAFGVL